MDERRQSINRRQRPRDPLERRMDQWFETGRQFVDGVSGNRPGQRRKESFGIRNRASIENAGRWMGEKLDWFFEEDDDWSDVPEIQENSQLSFTSSKRPLQAISLRVPKAIAPSVQSELTIDDEWPDETSFRIDRWQRTNSDQDQISREPLPSSQRKPTSSRRPLPRSSRRRD